MGALGCVFDRSQREDPRVVVLWRIDARECPLRGCRQCRPEPAWSSDDESLPISSLAKPAITGVDTRIAFAWLRMSCFNQVAPASLLQRGLALAGPCGVCRLASRVARR